MNINHEILTNKALMLYIRSNSCAVCKALEPKVEQSFSQNFPLIKRLYVDLEDYSKELLELKIMSSPTILVFFEHKEFFRFGANVSINDLEQKTKRVYEMLF